LADELYAAAVSSFSLSKSVVRVNFNQAVGRNLPPTLAETIPELPPIQQQEPAAIVCTGFTCRPPIFDPKELRSALETQAA